MLFAAFAFVAFFGLGSLRARIGYRRERKKKVRRICLFVNGAKIVKLLEEIEHLEAVQQEQRDQESDKNHGGSGHGGDWCYC